MFGQTVKSVGTFDTEEGSYVYVEEYAAPSMTGATAAPTGSATHRIEYGPFDAETAQRTYTETCREHPMGHPTPAMTF